jgi:uncharacterized protein YdiU (UPF0061 family)
MTALRVDDRFVRSLPGDPSHENRPRQVHGACWSPVAPTPVRAPQVIAVADEVAALLGLTPDEVRAHGDVWGGNRLLPGMKPYAACYGGHQFGNWAGQLGDGRAMTLGEIAGWEVQLKGAGPTPYSRHADGRAVLRSSVREFLCSEAMFHLGVPTTRALCLVTTGDEVVRDMFYDGRPNAEPGAIVVRVAESLLRLGSFEIHAARNDLATLRRLVDHARETFFPGLDVPGMLAEVARRTAEMVVGWQRVGFVHGVMNTDNLSLLGLTIDYGPYGWLEDYDPDWTPNTTDAGHRRYRFGNQPSVAMWNLSRFAEALLPLVGEPEPLEAGLEVFAATFHARHGAMWCAKLGLRPRPEDTALLTELSAILRLVETDYTLFFRGLADVGPADRLGPLEPAWYAAPSADARARILAWVDSWLARAAQEPDSDSRKERMNAVNPKYVLRNWLAQLAIDRAEAGDPTGIAELQDVLRHPYDDQPGREGFAVRRPDWARDRAGCSMLSCSS